MLAKRIFTKTERIKVKYVGEETLAFEYDKIYEVMAVENGWYRIMTELDEDYIFPPECFEIVNSTSSGVDK